MQDPGVTTRRGRRHSVLALAACSVLCLVVAGTMRLMDEALPAVTTTVAHLVAAVGASAAGAGMVLFGATLVVTVLSARGLRVPMVLGTVAGAVALGAVVAGAAAAVSDSAVTVTELITLRTALAALASAALPAVTLGAFRARASRQRSARLAATSSSLRRPRRALR